MPAARLLRTARLVLRPVGWADLPDVARLKADPQSFAQMLGGIRSPAQASRDMADDIAFWGENGIGIYTMRENNVFRGITGFHDRPDGRGIGLRFSLTPEARGRGLAQEGAGAALRFAHDEGWPRIVAVSREDNHASRLVLGGIGMTVCDRFPRAGHPMLVYQSIRQPS